MIKKPCRSVIAVALIASGISVFAQGTQPQANTPANSATNASANTPANSQDPSKAKPKSTILLLKNDVKTAYNVVVPKSQKEQNTAILKSPLSNDGSTIVVKPVVQKVKSQSLPGLGVLPGEPTDAKIKSVRVGSDRNELVYISLSQLNKIATPFESPKVIDSTNATLKTVGQDIYIQPSSDAPLTIYISDGGVGQSVGLTLVPKTNIPAQSIVIEPESSKAAKIDSDDTAPSDYSSRLTSIIKQLALEKTPNGFTKSRLPTSSAVNGQLIIEPQFKYAGTSYDVFTYKVKSISSSPLEMKEESFYTKEVRAVAFFPLAMLQRDEETSVFVIADRVQRDDR